MKLFWVFAAAAVFAVSCNKETGGRVSYPQKLPSAGDIPVMGWFSIPPSQTSDAMYREMRDAGFTLSYTNFRGEYDRLEAALDAAHNAGIKLFLRCYALEGNDAEARMEIVDEYKDHPALAGWFLDDEPVAAKFDEMQTWKSQIRRRDGVHPCYINLLPDVGESIFQTMGISDYAEYLENYISKLQPEFLSFATYPVIKGLDGKVKLYADNWFPTLEQVSSRARRDGIPFWAFALSTAHTPLADPNRPVVNNYDDHFPVPTIEQLRVQMWNNLAYGAQVLQYFTYWTPETYEDSDFWYGGGPKLADGTTGPAYDVVKRMNDEIQKLSGVFHGCSVKWVRHTGETIPSGTRRLSDLPPQVANISVSGPGATVSLIENKGFTFLVFVSRTLDEEIEIRMSPASQNVKLVQKDASIVEPTHGGNYPVGPGDILIFVLDGPK